MFYIFMFKKQDLSLKVLTLDLKLKIGKCFYFYQESFKDPFVPSIKEIFILF